MSEEAIETIRSAYERFNATGDLTHILDAMDPAVEFEIAWRTGRDSPDFQVLHGIAEVRDALKENLEPFDRLRVEVHEYREAGEDVVAILEFLLTPKGSSAEVSTGRFGYVFTFRDGKIVRVQDFPDPSEALRVAGLG